MTHILIAATTILALVSASAVAADSNGAETTLVVCTDPEMLSADAVYVGGATIIALAAFGSALGTGVVVGRYKNAKRLTVYLITGGAALITVSQVFIMWHACCGGPLYAALPGYLVVTGIGAFSVIFGFVVKMGNQLEKDFQSPDRGQSPEQEGKRDEGQSSAPDGATTELHIRFKSRQGTGDKP